MKLRAAAVAALAAGLCACVGYPNIFLAGRQGQIPTPLGAVEGAPSVKIAIVRDCEDNAESYETMGKSARVTPDASGRYKIGLAGFAWDWFNLVNGAYCQSRIQLYSCPPSGAACAPLGPKPAP